MRTCETLNESSKRLDVKKKLTSKKPSYFYESIQTFFQNSLGHKTLSLKISYFEFNVSVSVDKMQLLTHTSIIQNE